MDKLVSDYSEQTLTVAKSQIALAVLAQIADNDEAVTASDMKNYIKHVGEYIPAPETELEKLLETLLSSVRSCLIASLQKTISQTETDSYTIDDLVELLNSTEFISAKYEKKKVKVAKETPPSSENGPILTSKDEAILRNATHLPLEQTKEGFLVEPRTFIIFQQKSDNHYYAVGIYQNGKRKDLTNEHKQICQNNFWKISKWEDESSLEPILPTESKKQQKTAQKNTQKSVKPKAKSKSKKK